MKKLNEKNNRLPIFCYDIYLKSLFTKYPSILEKFIVDVTDIDYELLKGNTELSTNEIPISRKNEKGKRCDFIVTVKGQKNWVINIELNYHYSDGLRERNCAYVSSLFSRAFQKGVIYDNSSKVYQKICKGILNESEVKQVMDEFKELTKEDLLMTKEEAERWGKLYADIIYNDGVNDGIEKGISQGYDKGKSEGIMQGHFEGLKQGIEQTEKDNIMAMHVNGASLDFISKVTNKDENYIKNIIYEIN